MRLSLHAMVQFVDVSHLAWRRGWLCTRGIDHRGRSCLWRRTRRRNSRQGSLYVNGATCLTRHEWRQLVHRQSYASQAWREKHGISKRSHRRVKGFSYQHLMFAGLFYAVFSHI